MLSNRLIPSAQIRLIVFDLDGTLIDSRKDLVTSVNAALVQFDRQPLPEEIIASYIGDGAGMLIRRALGDPSDETLVDSALTAFLDYYREHKLDHTTVYEGVFPALDRLSPGRTMACLTNKPVNPSQQICAALGLAPYFFRTYGGNSFQTRKPDPEGLRTLMQEAGAGPAQTVMVGDSDVDILTAQRAGTWSIGCRYGLSPHTVETIPPDAVVDSPSEWPAALGL
jgi:phosphoglycolate phosphatase